MKKQFLIAALVFSLGVLIFSPAVEAFPRYWQQYLEQMAIKYNRADLVEKYSGYTSRKPNVASTNRVIFSQPKYQTPYTPRKSVQSRKTVKTSFVNTQTEHRVSMNVRSLEQRTAAKKIDTTPIDIFEISFTNKNVKSSTRHHEALLVDRLNFSLIDNSGAFDEAFKNLMLVVGDQSFRVDADGDVSLKFHNLRLSSGEKKSIRVGIRIDDPSNIPHINGSLRVRLTSATGRTESTEKNFPLLTSGTSVSNLIAFAPVSTPSGTASFAGSGAIQIYGKMLTAGQEAYVLAANFQANYDDLFIDEIILRDVVSGNAVDVFIDEIVAIDLDTGRELASTRFVNGKAKFRFRNRIRVYRNKQKGIAFKVRLDDRIPASNLNTQFRLTLDASGVGAQSASTGRYVADSNKTFSLKNETFVVAESVLTVVSPKKQTRSLIIGAGKQLVYDFTAQSKGRNSTSLSRFSVRVSPNNVSFPVGISADDFELVSLDESGNILSTIPTTITVTGDAVQFDMSRPMNISRGSLERIGVKMALENNGTVNDSDGIVVSLLGDSSLHTGSLTSVGAAGANFIWSDGSASSSSSSWRSGYLVPGIPSNSVSFKRDY